MNEQIRQVIIEGKAHALATTGPHGINVVPISVVELCGNEIHLYDFFMRKTAENIAVESSVSFSSWKGFSGVQVKAVATYDTSGEVYETAVMEMKQRFPDRTLRAVIRLAPTAVYDIAPGARGESLLNE